MIPLNIKKYIASVYLFAVMLISNLSCSSSPSRMIEPEKKQSIDPSISQMYLDQLSCSDSIAKCHSGCLKMHPPKKYVTAKRRVLCEEECYQNLKREYGCVFYQSTSFR